MKDRYQGSKLRSVFIYSSMCALMLGRRCAYRLAGGNVPGLCVLSKVGNIFCERIKPAFLTLLPSVLLLPSIHKGLILC